MTISKFNSEGYKDMTSYAALSKVSREEAQLAAVHIVCFIAQKVEKLGVDHADEEVEGGIRVRHDEEQCRFLIAQRVQLQLVFAER